MFRCGYLSSNSENIDWFPRTYVSKEGEQPENIEDTSLPQEPESPEEPEVIYAETLYDYTAEHGDELTVLPGMKVVVIDQSNVDWWTARTEDGTVGLLPASYLNILSK
jgi:hypothetical protein